MACEMAGGDYRPALDIAHALEMFHNFTLLHDDIMDKSQMRRGKPAVHKKWGENTAILSGDAMVMLSYKLLGSTAVPNMEQIARRFTEAGLNVCRGQQYDMDFERSMDVRIDQYMEMIRLKTAELLSVSLELGALAGGAGREMVGQLRAYGTSLGLAFQLQDDYLDSFGDERTFGKPTGSDIANNKKTWLLISALQEARGKDKETLMEILESPLAERGGGVGKVLHIYRQLGLDKKIKQATAHYLAQARQAIQDYAKAAPTAIELLNKLENRNK
jgi:geranylgeranyl diphosphate synthase type II